MSGRGDYGRLLGPEGPLARVIDGFESRREQQHMADWVGEALASLDLAYPTISDAKRKDLAAAKRHLLGGK